VAAAVLPGAEPEEDQAHVVFPGPLDDQIDNRGVELAR
jgi:hypothetical protein